MKGMGEATKFLPEGSAGKALIDEAKLGAGLTADVQAEVTKGALEGASAAGIAGSAAGRGLVARDIGISSAALRQARLAAALGVEQNAATQFLKGEELRGNSIFNMGQLSSRLELPEAGLSTAEMANLTIAENNGANQYAVDRVAAENAAASERNKMLQGLFSTAAGAAPGFADLFKVSTPPISPAPAIANRSAPTFGVNGQFVNPLAGPNANLFAPFR
jgi:hypothetical protein